MSNRRRQDTSAVRHRAKPSAGNGKARPNGGQSGRSDARDGPEQAMPHTPHAICRGFYYVPHGNRTERGTLKSPH